MATWDSFLEAVDEVSAPEPVREAVKTSLVSQGLEGHQQATGLEPAPLAALASDGGLALAAQELVARTIRTLNAADEVAKAQALRGVQRQDSVPSAANPYGVGVRRCGAERRLRILATLEYAVAELKGDRKSWLLWNTPLRSC